MLNCSREKLSFYFSAGGWSVRVNYLPNSGFSIYAVLRSWLYMTVISFEHKFVFIKTRKAASTSVEAYLRRYLGSEDVATYVTPRDEKWCVDRGWASRNYCASRADEERYASLCGAGDFEEALKSLRNIECQVYNHMPARDVKAYIESKGYKWSDFFSFTVDRDPYSWLLSMLLYNNAQYNANGECSNDLQDINSRAVDFLRREDISKQLNPYFYSDEGELMVDRVLHYECLCDDLAGALEPILGSVDLENFPFLKKNANHLSATEIFSEEVRGLIEVVAGDVFRLAGYEP